LPAFTYNSLLLKCCARLFLVVLVRAGGSIVVAVTCQSAASRSLGLRG
jgi:hypothetical protein